MKVAIVDLGAVWGGQEKYSALLMEGLKSSGNEIISVNSQPMLNGFSDMAVSVSESYMGFWRIRREIRKLIKRENIDLIHFNGNRAMYLAALGGWGIPVIATKHLPYRVAGKLTVRQAFARTVAAILFSRFSAIICVAQATYLDLPKCLRKLGVVIVNGVKGPKSVHGRYCTKAPVFRVCYVARLAEHKGIGHLLAAVQILVDEGYTIELHIAGSGPLKDKVELIAARNSTQIFYYGFVEDPTFIYENSDVCCLPSEHEGMPLNILEAMAFGVPVLGTNIPGVSEVVSDKNGWLMPDNRVSTIVEYLRDIIRNPMVVAEKAIAARQGYEENFSVDKMVQCTLDVYLKAIRN